MTVLYEFPPTRSQRVRWVLEELGTSYSSYKVDLPKGEQGTEKYRSVQPVGVVPALKTGNYTMFESVAIVMQLIDENPEHNLAPAVGSALRAHYYQWCVFACAELDVSVMMFYDYGMRQPETQLPPGWALDANVAARGKANFDLRAKTLVSALAGKNYLVGDTFSGADILVGHSCYMATHMNLLAAYPELVAYYAYLQDRPAFQTAYRGFY